MKELSKMVYQDLALTNEMIKGIVKSELIISIDNNRRNALFLKGKSTPIAANEKPIRDALYVIRQIFEEA